MSLRGGQSITVDFTTRNSSGALANADSLPAGTLVVNGVDNGATVTVANKATGRYKAAVTLPALAVGDVVQLYVAATVGGVADGDYVWEDSADLLISAAGKTTDAVQTGDSYARLGAPAGASVSADLAAVKGETDTILADVDTGAGAIYNRLGAPAGASLAADIAALPAAVWASGSRTLTAFAFTVTLPANPPAGFLVAASYGTAPGWYTAPVDVSANVTAIKAKTDSLTFTTAGKVDAKLTADGLDAISVADPGAPAGHTTLSKMLVAVWRALWKKGTLTATQEKRYADNGTTVNAAAALSDDGTTQTRGDFT